MLWVLNSIKMKKIAICVLTALMMFTFMPVSFAAEPVPVTVPAPKPMEPAEAQLLINRLNEIKDMDKREMSAEQRKELRQEKNSIKKELRSGGVYLSVGALLVVVILLIILL